MHLMNTTAATARAIMATMDDAPGRRGMVVAKVTFRVADDGELAIDREDPAPIFSQDTPHPLGLLPTDLVPVTHGRCEIIVLGQAHAPAGRAATSQRIELAVGAQRQAIDVFGDRAWQGGPTGWSMGAAKPYATVPLTWDRTFGGTARVWLDRDSAMPVSDDINPAGRGFDARARGRALGEVMLCAAGYPVVEADDRLPNLEDPHAPIQRRGDTPDPLCWATVPIESPLPMLRAIRLAQAAGRAPPAHAMAAIARPRCHPQWLIDPPTAGTPIELRGMTPSGRLRCRFPAAHPTLDYHVGDRVGSRSLGPVRVVLLPEESRMCVLFAMRFTAPSPVRGEPRSGRLRLIEPDAGVP